MTTKVYEHKDSLGQDLQPGQAIAFTSSYLQGVKVGTIVKLTRLRVKIRYNYTYKTREGEQRKSSWTTLIAPDRTIALVEQLPQALTWHLLKNT